MHVEETLTLEDGAMIPIRGLIKSEREAKDKANLRNKKQWKRPFWNMQWSNTVGAPNMGDPESKTVDRSSSMN
jgi:hypothetical protein